MNYLSNYLTLLFICLVGGLLKANNFDLPIPENLACNDTINLSLDSNCEAVLTPDLLLEAPDDGEDYQIFIIEPADSVGNFKNNGTDSVIVLQSILYKYSVVNSASRTCWGYVRGENKLLPTFTTLPRDTIVRCAIALTENGIGATKPTAATSCISLEVNFLNAFVEQSSTLCDTTIVASLWQAIDARGNEVIDTQRTVFVRPTQDQLIAPKDIILSCGENDLGDIENLSITGDFQMQLGKIINNTFVPEDTISLNEEAGQCSFALTKTDFVRSKNCDTEVTRYWELIDWCMPDIRPIPIDTQIISYKDTLAPVFDKHPHANLQNAQIIELGEDCRFDVPLLYLTATDNCDSATVEMYEVAQLIDGIWTPIGTNDSTTIIPADTLRLGYRAFDACPNQLKEDTTYTYLITRDLTAPAVICANNLVINIGDNLGITLKAETIDGGSFDDCGSIRQSIRLMGDTTWYSSILLPCEFIDSQLMVELRIMDEVGNENFCWTTVRLEDKIPPICQDIPDMTVTCEVVQSNDFGINSDANNNRAFDDTEWRTMTTNQMLVYNEAFGNPACQENVLCKSFLVEQEYQRLNIGCGVGTLRRRYRAIDSQGNIGNWAVQEITVTYQPNWKITLPADWEGDCMDTIPAPFWEVQAGICDNFSVNITQKSYTADEDYCLKVERVYQFINHCLFEGLTTPLTIPRVEAAGNRVVDSLVISSDSLGTEGYFLYKQILKIRSTNRPNLVINEVETCLSGVHLDTFPNKMAVGCAELKTFSASATDCLGDSVEHLQWQFFENDSLTASGDGASFTRAVIPTVDYTVQFIATDNCQNQTVERKDFSFIDCVKPTLFTRNGTVLELKQRTAEIWATDFDKGSYDNCTDQATLLENFRIWHEKLGPLPTTFEEVRQLTSNLTLTCENLASNQVSIFVFDEFNNYDRIDAFIIVQDNQESCIRNRMTNIQGEIRNEVGERIEAVNVLLTGTMEANHLTKIDGRFNFDLPAGYEYALQPYKNDDYLNGVTTFDLILISKHILGVKPFTSPYQRIAADVNNSGTITTRDLVQLRRLILDVDDSFPNNDSWRFVEADYRFQTTTPEREDFPEAIYIPKMEEQPVAMDFIGVKIGDVNGTASANLRLKSEARNNNRAHYFELENQLVKKGEMVHISFFINDLSKLEGLQVELNFDAFSETNFMEGIVRKEHVNPSKLAKGSVGISWNSTKQRNSTNQLFILKGKATKTGYLKDLIFINEDKMAAEVYTQDGQIIPLGLKFKTSGEPPQFEVFQNQPNPFHQETAIHFYLPQKEHVQLQILDLQGKVLKSIQDDFEKGYQTISINQHDLSSSGILYYQLTAGKYSSTKKMVVLD